VELHHFDLRIIAEAICGRFEREEVHVGLVLQTSMLQPELKEIITPSRHLER